MKNLFKFFTLALLACSALLVTSCGDDDGPEIITGGDLLLADGFYLAAEGVDPVAGSGLSSESVEGDGFTPQDRSGFVAGYVYLSAGNYNLVNVTAKEISSTIGGTTSTVTDENSACDFNDYVVVKTAVDGPAFAIAADGLYKVSYDATIGEMVIYQIVQPSLIGSATPNGWSTDTPLTGSATATGGSYSISGLEMRAGEYKVRFNCRWTINRRLNDDGNDFSEANGYQMFSNFGTSAADLQVGGSNIPFDVADEGIYTVTADWSPTDGWSLDLEKTGDVAPITFDPADFDWGILGDATANEWANDRNMSYKEVNGVPTWFGVVTLLGTGNIKFRINDNWDELNLGGALPADGSEATLSAGGSDIPTPGAGMYYITLKTADEGATWVATMEQNGWGVIGEGSPVGNWDADMNLTANGFVDGIETYTITGDFTTANWKLRAGDGWDYNLGGDMMMLSHDGSDLSISAAGNYTLTLSYDGETYSVTVQ